jgi:8-oxo-dGTP pyrophosphatase MutT (NUDIX family)
MRRIFHDLLIRQLKSYEIYRATPEEGSTCISIAATLRTSASVTAAMTTHGAITPRLHSGRCGYYVAVLSVHFMSVLRPSHQIKVKAIGLNWRDGRLLAAEVRDGDGKVTGVRPLGGSVEFGERAEVAVRREFQEELGIDVSVVNGPLVFENLYTHAGEDGHEVVFVFEVEFPQAAFEGCDRIDFHESDGSADVARWYGLDELDVDGFPKLYPMGLKAALSR